MPEPVDLLHTAAGDVDFALGLRFTSNRVDFVKQKLSETLSFWQGEWFLDLRQGIPFVPSVYGTRPDFRLLHELFTRAALRTRGVGRVADLKLSLAGRKLTIAGTVQPVAEGSDVPAPAPFLVTSLGEG